MTEREEEGAREDGTWRVLGEAEREKGRSLERIGQEVKCRKRGRGWRVPCS